MKNSMPLVTKFPKSNFPLLFMSRLISDFGMAIFKFSLSLYILDITGSPSAFSLILTLTILPGAIMNIFAGVIVDKYDKKKIIIASDLLCGLFVFLIFLMLKQTADVGIWVFGVYVVIISIIQTFLNLSINSSLSNLMEENAVPKANSMFQAMSAILAILGPVISSILYVLIGIEFIILINALTYVLGAGISVLLKFRKVYENQDEQQDGFVKNLKIGFSYIKGRKVIHFLLINLLLLNFVYMPLTMHAVNFITYNVLEVSEFELSLIQASLGVGVIIGAIYIGIQSSKQNIFKRLPLSLCILTITIGLWGFPLLKNTGTFSTTQIVIGYGLVCLIAAAIYTSAIIPIYTFFQTEVPDHLRGRVFGVATSALNISIPIGILIYGFLLETFHWQYVIWLSTTILFLLFIFSWGYLKTNPESFVKLSLHIEGDEKV